MDMDAEKINNAPRRNLNNISNVQIISCNMEGQGLEFFANSSLRHFLNRPFNICRFDYIPVGLYSFEYYEL